MAQVPGAGIAARCLSLGRPRTGCCTGGWRRGISLLLTGGSVLWIMSVPGGWR
jgi:hypothetical protein